MFTKIKSPAELVFQSFCILNKSYFFPDRQLNCSCNKCITLTRLSCNLVMPLSIACLAFTISLPTAPQAPPLRPCVLIWAHKAKGATGKKKKNHGFITAAKISVTEIMVVLSTSSYSLC